LAGRVMTSIQEHAARVNVSGGCKTADVEAFVTHDKTTIK
jgi:hypothetical protein